MAFAFTHLTGGLWGTIEGERLVILPFLGGAPEGLRVEDLPVLCRTPAAGPPAGTDVGGRGRRRFPHAVQPEPPGPAALTFTLAAYVKDAVVNHDPLPSLDRDLAIRVDPPTPGARTPSRGPADPRAPAGLHDTEQRVAWTTSACAVVVLPNAKLPGSWGGTGAS